MNITLPTVVDEMNDPVMTPYGGWPERIYIIDAFGAVEYQGAQGPSGFKPEEAVAHLTKAYGWVIDADIRAKPRNRDGNDRRRRDRNRPPRRDR
jgi:hypothetical protein